MKTSELGKVDISWATSPGQLKQVRLLFVEYARSLGALLAKPEHTIDPAHGMFTNRISGLPNWSAQI